MTPVEMKEAVPRMIACWDACEGIPTSALESCAVARLVEAARDAMLVIAGTPGARTADETEAIRQLRSALAEFTPSPTTEAKR